jgi:AcrR family transcriptional regulator
MLTAMPLTREESPRRRELLELTFRYVAQNGLSELTLRPLAAAIGSSPRVLLYLFGSKDGLVREVLGLARERELEFMADVGQQAEGATDALRRLWDWLDDSGHAPVLRLWVESYARSLNGGEPWAGFAAQTVTDWLAILRPLLDRPGESGRADATLTLAVLRGLLLDVLATGDNDRVRAALDRFLGDAHPA